ncbi:hypothetical protein [Anaerolentibacter hominis]|uniref:hypothetical protein n=1 Tax=Anaerolentibacter hominis TaxID=3079009 RepID=UPI0031B8081A
MTSSIMFTSAGFSGRNTLLRIVSILLIVLGSLKMLGCILGAVLLIRTVASPSEGSLLLGSAGLILAFAGLPFAILEFRAGIYGIRNYRSPAKLCHCVSMGILLLTLYSLTAVVILVLSIVSTGISVLAALLFYLIFFAPGLVLSILYTAGSKS